MMLDSLTGSSCLRKTNDVFSQALMEPEKTDTYKTHLDNNNNGKDVIYFVDALQ